VQRPSLDTLFLFVLLVARARIDTLAEWAAIPTAMLQRDVARLLGGLLPTDSLTLLADRQTTDPVTLLLISLAFGLFLVYLAIDISRHRLPARLEHRLKLGLVVAVVGLLVFGQTLLFIGLRHVSGPGAYTHDGGVIQTEVTIQYLSAGVNPYVADYLDTPMAEWGTEYRTALYHYPYLPWTFLFSAPFCLLSHLTIGWFDERMVYLLLFAVTLMLACRLARNSRDRLIAIMVLGLNPILASDMIFGQNDSFVLFWIVLGVWLLWQTESGVWSTAGRRHVRWLSAATFGLACASKPTAWFVVPFLCLYLIRDELQDKTAGTTWTTRLCRSLVALAGRVWPLGVVVVLVVGPWFVWDAAAMIDDVWSWSAGSAQTSYQMRGWGFSNFILALRAVPDRLAYWPFWVTELLMAGPLLVAGMWYQARRNTLNAMMYGYVVLLVGFSYASRFMNENYLGFLLSVMALASFVSGDDEGAGPGWLKDCAKDTKREGEGSGPGRLKDSTKGTR
jgi:hypothetical protein